MNSLQYVEGEIASLQNKMRLETRPYVRRRIAEQIALAEREAQRQRDHIERRGGGKNDEQR